MSEDWFCATPRPEQETFSRDADDNNSSPVMCADQFLTECGAIGHGPPVKLQTSESTNVNKSTIHNGFFGKHL